MGSSLRWGRWREWVPRRGSDTCSAGPLRDCAVARPRHRRATAEVVGPSRRRASKHKGSIVVLVRQSALIDGPGRLPHHPSGRCIRSASRRRLTGQGSDRCEGVTSRAVEEVPRGAHAPRLTLGAG